MGTTLFPAARVRRGVHHLALMLLLLFTGSAQGQQGNPGPTTAPSTQPSYVDYEKIIGDLNSDDPATRRAASLRLNSMGGEALGVVRKALEGGDAPPEAQARLKRALPLLTARFRLETIRQEQIAYLKKSWADAYKKAGANPKWDGPAEKLLERFLAHQYRTLADRDVMIDLYKQAFAAGCRNEVVKIAMGCVLGLEHQLVPPEASMGAWHGMLDKYILTDAPPAVRLLMIVRAAGWKSLYPDTYGKPAVGAIRAMLAEPGAPPGFADDFAAAVRKAMAERDIPDGERATEAFVAAYAELQPLERPGRHIMLGDFAIQQAWKARGSGWAGTVTPEGWKLFKANLDDAQQHLEAAWKLDPQDARIGTHMITVCLGQGYDLTVVDRWYQRAMKADPDCFQAASNKLYYLYPRWYGSHEAMVSFGRDCLATENWRGGIPFILVHAHAQVAQESGDEKAYFLDPVVWADIKRVYEGYLLNAPDDFDKRSQFARYATRAEQWTDAHEQFQILKDNAVYAYFGGKGTYDYLKRKAARLGGAATQPVAPR